jgi:hypothetical protein
VPGNFVNITKAKIICFFLVLLGGTNIINSAQEAHGQKIVELQSDPNVKQLKPLMHKGKPFFPIGAYQETRSGIGNNFTSFASLKNQGWNTVLKYVGTDACDIELLNRANSANMAIILSVSSLVNAQDKNEVKRKVALLKNYPAVLGWYSFDEPENVYGTEVFSRINAKIGWAKPLIKSIDTDISHYVFICLASWNCYSTMESLYQVNMPNHYPTENTSAEFEGPQSNIVYDAKLAAEAAFASGGLGFCYTPGARNILPEGSKYRPPTINEFRYSVFAPITQGAMGIIYWAGYLCNPPYTEQVVFPVTRQLSELTPFFLGKWLDEKLQCEPSQSSTPLLKKLDLPTVSGCLRESDNGKYLLLAVNNRAEITLATFRVNIERLPSQARDFITGRLVPIIGGEIKDLMGPYGVHAYIIEQAN